MKSFEQRFRRSMDLDMSGTSGARLMVSRVADVVSGCTFLECMLAPLCL